MLLFQRVVGLLNSICNNDGRVQVVRADSICRYKKDIRASHCQTYCVPHNTRIGSLL